MWGGLEAHLKENSFDHTVPMMGGLTESIECFLQEPVFIFLESWVSNWRSYDCNLIIWQDGVTERVLAVTLLGYTLISHCLPVPTHVTLFVIYYENPTEG